MAQKETSSKSRRWLGLSGAAVLVANLVLTGTTIFSALIPTASMQRSGRGIVVEPYDFIGWEKNTILQP